jgi:small subunit ribosomal protein S16
VVRIRLRRMGAKKKPTYRIVVANQKNARDGRFIEIVGTYDPHAQTEVPNSGVTLQSARVAHWLSVGAQPSDSVARLLRNAGLLDENNKPVALENIEESSESAIGAAPEAATDTTANTAAEPTTETESSDEEAVAA